MNAPGENALQKFTVETIESIRPWTRTLFSFRTTRHRAFRFVAGQFARLGVIGENGPVWRAYSMVSAPYDDHLEFISVVVPGGEFTERLARLGAGDELLIDRTAFGFLTTDRFGGEHEGARDLWLLASGTGIAPFISILADPDTWSRFGRVILVHSVRHAAELAYRDEIAALPLHPLVGPSISTGSDRLRYVPVVTREPGATTLDARITTLLADGRLETEAGIGLEPEHSRLMVCGNPEMVRDVRASLGGRGFRVNRQRAPGQMVFENYW